MRMESWVGRVLVNSTLTQAAIYVIRPMITYRSLEIGLSPGQIGVIAALYAVLPVLLALQFGSWVGQIGESKFLIYGALAMALCGLLFVYAHSFLTIAILSASAGLAHLACMVGGQTLIALRSKDADHNANFGYYTFSASLGHTIGPLAGAWIAGSSGTLPRSTSAAFYLSCFIAFIGAIVLLNWWRNPATVQARRDAGTLSQALNLLKKPRMAATVYISLVASSTQDVLVLLIPLFGNERGFTSTSIGYVLGVRGLTGMISRFYLGRLTNRFDAHVVLMVSLFGSTALLVGMGASHSVLFLGIVTALAGFTLGIAQPLTMTNVTRITDADERAMGVSLRLMGNRFGQVIYPAAAGVLAGLWGAGWVFYVLSAAVATAIASGRKA